MFLDVTRSLLGCYRFAVALRAPVALVSGLRLDAFSYLDKRLSLGLCRYFSLFSQTKLIQSGYTRERRKMKGAADGV